MKNNQPLEAKDFSGGFTDNYLSGPTKAGQVYDNLLINNNRKPFTRFGSEIEDETLYQVPSGVKRISYLWDHRDRNLEQTERHIYYKDTTYKEILGPTGNQAFGSNTEDNHISKAFWNNHSLLVSDSFCNPMKVFKNGSLVFKIVNAGLPAISAPTVTAGAPGVNNYIYGFLYYYTYNVEGVTFEDFGATVQVALSNAAAPDATTVNITNIPVISNGTTDNYDTTTIKVKIYRTENDQTTLKFIGEVTNGTTVYNDSASDASITNNVVIYTTGDVVDNDPPPPAKFVHIANDIALYGYPKEGSIEVPNRVRQSIKGDIDSCPEDFFIDFPEEVMGIRSIQGTFIVFCKESTFRVDGFFDEQGRGGLTSLKISDTVGCVSNDSIVQTDDYLLFASKQGFYVCDGYKVSKISHHFDKTYSTLVDNTEQARNICGDFDKIGKRVWWGVQKNQSSLDNDSCMILDLNWGISDESCFTTASNGSSFAPTFLLFKEGNLYRADKRGYVFLHDDQFFTDPRVDITVLPVDWATKTIIHDYASSAFDFGTSFVRKFVPEILLTLANISNIAVTIYSINDDGRQIEALTDIRYNNNLTWGDKSLTWGDASLIWNLTGLIEEKRHFPAKNLRCNYKQIRITNALTPVENSDSSGEAIVNFTAKTLTLLDVTKFFPDESVGYFVSFEDDNYVRELEITERNSDTQITFLDPLGEAPITGDYKWIIRGYRKGEFLNILSYVIHYRMLSDSQKAAHVGESGEISS